MPQGLTIDIQNRTRSRISEERLRKLLKRALACQRISRGEWRIMLVDDATMAELHGRTMGLPTTTDVLTFDLRRGGRGPLDLDTAICVDEARRQALARRHTVGEEVLLYAIHSLLHVCGHDDISAADAARMHQHEDAILNTIGVGSVYASRAAGAAHRPVGSKSKRARR